MESHRHAFGLWAGSLLLSLPSKTKRKRSRGKTTGHARPSRPSLPAHRLPVDPQLCISVLSRVGSVHSSDGSGANLHAPRSQEKKAQGATQNGGGYVNLARHVRCSTVSQPSRTLFQHRVQNTTTAFSGPSARPIGLEAERVDLLLGVAIHGPDYCGSIRPSQLHKSPWKFILDGMGPAVY